MSQVGVLGDVLDNAPNVTTKGRLGPGQMVMADLQSGTFKENTQIAKEVAAQAPYKEWLKRSMRCVLIWILVVHILQHDERSARRL
jgi:hypothetical protein